MDNYRVCWVDLRALHMLNKKKNKKKYATDIYIDLFVGVICLLTFSF